MAEAKETYAEAYPDEHPDNPEKYPDKSDIQQEANEQGFEVWLDNCDKNDLINLIGEDIIKDLMKERWLKKIESE